MKINVLEFLPSIADGGIQSTLASYCKFIDKNKFSIYCVTLFPLVNGKSLKSILDSNCKIFSILKIIHGWDNSIFIRFFKKIFSKYYICFKLKKIIKKYDIKTIHLHIDVLQYLARLSKFLNKKHIKVIYTCHSIPERWLGSKYFEEHNAAKILLKNNNLTMCALHKAMKNEIEKMFNIKNVLILENPIDFSFANNISKTEARRLLNIPANAFVIGDVCRLYSPKNLLFLIDVFNECYKINKNSFLLLACSGDNSSLKKSILEKINSLNLNQNFLMLIDYHDISYVYKTIDVFCSPSLFEGFSVSLLEAQISKIACVYSDINCSEANLTNSNIVLSTNDSAKKWANAILSLKDKNVILKPQINSYNIKNVIKKVEQLYLN